MMRWQCRFMHAQQEPYRLNQSDAHPRRNGDLVIAVSPQGDVGCFYSVLPADQSIRGWLGGSLGPEAREDINCRNAQTTPGDFQSEVAGHWTEFWAWNWERSATHTHGLCIVRRSSEVPCCFRMLVGAMLEMTARFGLWEDAWLRRAVGAVLLTAAKPLLWALSGRE